MTADDDNRSVRTRASSVQSSRSVMQNAKAKRLVAEHRLKMLKEKQRLERQQKEIENERELLEKESEIEVARIEESVFMDSNDETSGSVRATEQSSKVNGKTDNSLNSGSGNSSDSAFERLTSILQEGFNLPKPELLTFNGSVIDYCKFIKNFETNLESKVSNNRLRLSYLIQYCTGEAKSCIEDCVLLDSDEGYKQAKAILQSRYGRPRVIARSHIDKLLDGPQIKASDINELSKLALDMQRCQMTLSQLGFLSDVNNSENLRRFVRRLPMHMRTKWADIAHIEPININFGQSRDVILHQQLERMWTSDFNDASYDEKNSMSVEDKRALGIMESTLSHVNGHYEMGLPWRQKDINLPNNLALAHARLNQLKRKLSHDNVLHEMYTKTVTDYIDKGYAKEVTKNDTNSERIWYLPHHPVTNVNKPGKVRVVFDCAAKYKGISLNSQLLQGPDMMNSLVGVLTRFRQEKVALAADIEAMFHQVRVCEKDCDALRFLWWPGGDLSKTPMTYCMKVHLFGATSSPSCAAYALKRTASDNAERFEPAVISTVNRNFYVDDCLKSVESEDKAVKLAADLQSVMSLGGFKLTKWISNSRTVLNTIPESERTPTVVSLNPGDLLPCDRALGVNWNVNDDKITFKIKTSKKPLTRRGILSIVSAIFDPLGLVSPVTLRAKAIVQSLCRKKIGWDEAVPQKEMEDWQQWIANLPFLENISINRCFSPKHFSELTNIQLHVFSDGSETGYGACAYLRFTDLQNSIACSLVIGKSRLAPIKQTAIPRLELCGAVVACRLYAMLSEELDLKVDKVIFWTDSMILLGYINNNTRRFKTFVGNRISYIHQATSSEQWRYVDSGSNPADIASRGINPSDVDGLKTWLDGPEYLLRDESTWPQIPYKLQIADDDSEVKKEVLVNVMASYTGLDLHDLINYCSNWTRLQRAVAWLRRFITYSRRHHLTLEEPTERGDLSISELRNATYAILRHIQNLNFKQELNDISKGNPVKTDSKLATLNPILVNGLIRVYGRNAHKEYDTCPIILPHDSHVTELIIRHYQDTNGHVGKQQVLAETRMKYWILKGPSTVKKVIRGCFACKRQHSPPLRQQMAPLFKEQTTSDKPPFTYVGVDYFGPLIVKSGRTCLKRYGCLFSCLTTRAVHIEVAHSLTTDSFIAAYQRFTSRRGYPDKIYSDNGTNLVSGDKELKNSIREWNQSKIGRFLKRSLFKMNINKESYTILQYDHVKTVDRIDREDSRKDDPVKTKKRSQ